MIVRFLVASMIALSLIGPSANAQIGDFLKKVQPQNTEKKPQEKKEEGSKTEQLIFGGLKAVQGMMPIGYKEEMAIGGAVAVEAIARFGGLWQNEAVEKYVATVGTAVAQTSDRPEIPYYFGILNSDEPNGFACPGGYIFITKGLLKLVKNEAQLAGVLAHEVAHVSKKHALEAIRRSKALGGISEVSLTALDKDPKMFDSVVKEAINMIFESGLGRAKELEADAVGTEYAYRVGYRPTALRSFLEALKPAYQGGKSPLVRTHPTPQDRLNGLARVLRRPDYSTAASFPLLADRWTQSVTGANL